MDAIDLILRLHKEGQITTEEAKTLLNNIVPTVQNVPTVPSNVPWTTPYVPAYPPPNTPIDPVTPWITYCQNGTTSTNEATEIRTNYDAK